MLVISEPVSSCLIVMTWYSVGCLLFYFSVLVSVYFGWCVDEFQAHVLCVIFYLCFFCFSFCLFLHRGHLLTSVQATFFGKSVEQYYRKHIKMLGLFKYRKEITCGGIEKQKKKSNEPVVVFGRHLYMHSIFTSRCTY